tara:strand:+ start:5570 stop:9532 length:3963 start_codon:yes stop_codon:yes gene_type:complete
MARTGAAMVMFEVVGSFQAANMLKDAKAQMNILNAIVLNGLGGVFDATVDAAKQIASLADATVPVATNIAQARIQFEKFMGASQDLDATTEEIVRLGAEFGFTADRALEAGAKMAQLKDIVGGSAAVGAATEVGIKFAMIGDMETEEAMQRLINLQQQTSFMFGDMTQAQIEAMDTESRAMLVHENSMKVLTQLNTVENNSAATMQQLTFIMNQFAAQADMTGESISDMAASAAVMVEAGEEMGKAGRALRMIYARLGADTNNNNAALINAGVAVQDAEGNLRSLSDIVADLSKSFHTLTLEEQMNIAQLVAGNDHYVRFLKLIQNSERQQQLATMASLGLADAQEEVNIKLKDQSTALRIAEAELENARGALGDGLIPMQIKAVQQQTHFNRALNTFYTMQGTRGENAFGFAIRGLMDMSFHFERVHKVMGPVIEAMLNLKSLSVAMQTQQTIMRSMQGEQLMNPKFYQRVLDHQSNITRETMAEHQQRLRMNGAKAVALDMARMETQLESQRSGLTLERFKKMSLLAQEGVALNAVEEERFMILQQIANQDERLIGLKQQSHTQAQKALSLLHAEAAMKTTLSEREMTRIQNAIPAKRQELLADSQMLEAARNRLALAQAMGAAETVRLTVTEQNRDAVISTVMAMHAVSQEVAEAVADSGKELILNRQILHTRQAQLDIAEAQVAVDAKSEGLVGMVQRVAQTKLMNMEMMTQAQVQDRLNELDKEELNILMNTMPNSFRKNQLTEEEVAILQQLLPLMKEMNITNKQDAAILYDSVVANQVHADSMKATGIEASMAQQQMMKYSAAIGGASMLVGLFDNSTRGAKVSMMLMTPVMIASTFQMLSMTKAMMAQTSVTLTNTSAKIANTTATTAMGLAARKASASFLAFAATTGGMLVLVGALTAGLFAITDSSEDLRESIVRMNGALGESVQILTALEGNTVAESLGEVPVSLVDVFTKAGFDMANVMNMSQDEIQEVIRITKKEMGMLAIAADDGSSVAEQAFQRELEAANDFLAALEAQNVVLQANAILAGDMAAAHEMAALNALKNAQSAFEQFSTDEDNKRLFENIGFFGRGTKAFVQSSQKSGQDAAAALIVAYEQQIGQQLTRAKTEDLIEMLTGFNTTVLSGGEVQRGVSIAGFAASKGSDDAFLEFVQSLELSVEQLDMLQKALADGGDASDDTVDAIMKAMGKLDFDLTAREAQIIANTFDSVGTAGTDAANAIDGIGGALAGANQELFEFNNNREAMFFGFSQAGITGDFVKQVQQKGVENLIANTELIVNNTFNGMSLPEMVNQVTDGVVERLVAAGVVEEGAVEV